jgi:Protein of unknown function (DUF2384)
MVAETSNTAALGMTPGQAIAVLQRDLGMTMKDFHVVLDTTPRNIERWIQEQAYPQTKARRQLAQLMEFQRHLAAMFTDWDSARAWLNAPSRYLGGITPLEAMRARRLDRARAALLALDAGVYL